MTEFSTGGRTAVEQRVFCDWLASKFDAVEVTGLEGWGRIKKVYGLGLAEPEARNGATDGPSKVKETRVVSGSASPVQHPLFPDMEDAA